MLFHSKSNLVKRIHILYFFQNYVINNKIESLLQEEVKDMANTIKNQPNNYVYIMLTDTGSLFTRTIKAYTDCPYNHASLSLTEDLTDLYSFGRKRPRNPLNAGFVKEDILHGTYALFPKTKCAIYKLSVDEKTYRHIKKIVQHFEKNKSYYSYNLTGLLGVIINYPIERNTSYFCSQFVAHVLQRAHIPISHKKTGLVTPEDFRNSPLLELVYEGYLNNYPVILKTTHINTNKKCFPIIKKLFFDGNGKFRLFKYI